MATESDLPFKAGLVSELDSSGPYPVKFLKSSVVDVPQHLWTFVPV